MRLAGQASRRTDRGYAMAALLIAMSIMAVMMTVAMPVWKHQIQREREEELVFRGKQYMHAIALFQRKYANAFPPTVDVLVDQRFLRKKYKDPITNDDFNLLPAGAGTPTPGQTPGQGPPPARGSGPARGGTTVAPQPTQQTGQGQRGGPAGNSAGAGSLRGVSPIGTPGAGGGTTAGIGGVASKSKDPSIRLYNGRGHYNEWASSNRRSVAGQWSTGTAQPGQIGRRQASAAGLASRRSSHVAVAPARSTAGAAAPALRWLAWRLRTRSAAADSTAEPARAPIERARKTQRARAWSGSGRSVGLASEALSDLLPTRTQPTWPTHRPTRPWLGRRLVRDGFPAAA